jgi:DNA-binding LacI/PurR family transcriptional regulator
VTALYRQVYSRIRADIESHVLPVGERLPIEAQLAAQHRVSAITIKRALGMLRDDGLITRRPRLGTVVVADTVDRQPLPPPRPTFPAIGMVLTNFDDTFGTALLRGILDSAHGHAEVSVHRSDGRIELEDEIIRGLVQRGVEGMILEPTSSQYVSPAVLEMISRQFPVTIVDRALEGVPVSTVSSDHVDGARLLTQHLFDAGHTRIGLVRPMGSVSTLEDRHRGFILAHATHSVPHDQQSVFSAVESTGPSSQTSIDTDVARLREYVASQPQLTAFVACEYNIALMLVEACRLEGLAVPADRSVVCFDHPDLAFDLAHFRFTHARQPQAELGRLALRQTLAQLEAIDRIGKHVLPMTLVEGQSVRRLTTASRGGARGRRSH